MYKKVKNDKIIRCSICNRVLGTGKIKIDVVCIFCYKRIGKQLLGTKPLELKGQFDKLPEQEDFSKFLDY